MKEIKGLEERLYGLEQLMVETKKIVQEQSDLTQVHMVFKASVRVDSTPHFCPAKPSVKAACVFSSVTIFALMWTPAIICTNILDSCHHIYKHFGVCSQYYL
jgi:hypothetical protein